MRKILEPVALGVPALLFFILLSAGGVRDDSNSVQLHPDDSMEKVIAKSVSVRPSPRQLAWQEMEYIAFAHFGINTFTGKEWGNGKEDPKLFNPSAFDARQWAKACKDAGIKEIIVTAKHHDGFCLWPSKYTEHSVKNSPWKNGQGDVVKEVADACREYGLKLGVYLSPWDRHEKTYGTPAYNDYFKNQLRELLTNHGEVSEVWFDGAGIGDKWKTMQQLYDWKGYVRIVRELQPNAVIFQGGDLRWVGNEAGKGRESEWSVVPENFKAQDKDLGGRDKLMLAAKSGESIGWVPAEVDTSIRPGWYYHKREDLLVKSLPHLLNIYFDSVGNNGVLLLNLPPDKRGLLHKNDVKRILELRKALDQIFEKDLARNVAAQASAVRGKDHQYGADKTVDGNPETYWMTEDGVTQAEVVYDLGAPKTFNVAMLQEYIKQGQRVEEFYLEVWDGKDWKPVARSTTIGYKRLLRFEAVTAGKARVRITQSRVCPTLSNFSLFFDPGMAKGQNTILK